jgi:hypothetical protein
MDISQIMPMTPKQKPMMPPKQKVNQPPMIFLSFSSGSTADGIRIAETGELIIRKNPEFRPGELLISR